MPDGSGFGPSSAEQGVASTVNIPAARRTARIDTDNDRRINRWSGFFVMEVLLFLCDISM
jgi:hypothetical protein